MTSYYLSIIGVHFYFILLVSRNTLFLYFYNSLPAFPHLYLSEPVCVRSGQLIMGNKEIMKEARGCVRESLSAFPFDVGGCANLDYMNAFPLCLLSFSRLPVRNVSMFCFSCLVECEYPSFSGLVGMNTLPILSLSP